MIRFFEAEDKIEIAKLAADFTGEGFDSEEFELLFDEIVDGSQDECGIAVDYGSWFGGEEYAGFIRINLATRPENVEIAGF